MQTSVRKENYGHLFPRLTEVLQTIRNYHNPIVPWGYVVQEVGKKIGSEPSVYEAIYFLERELIVAVQKVGGIYHIAVIPTDIPKCAKIWLQMHGWYFEQVMNKPKPTSDKKD